MIGKRRLGFCLLILWSAMASSAVWAAKEPVQLARHGDQISVEIGGRPFTTYYFDPAVAKPYLQPLRSAQGTIVTRNFPIRNTVPAAHRHDHALEPHQRPLYFSHGDIDGLDFWGEQAFQSFYGRGGNHPYGRMVFHKLDEMQSGPQEGVIKAEFDLISPNKRLIASETQTFVFQGDGQTRTMDCEFVIHASHGPVVMGDTKEGTFGIRVAPELNSPPGHMIDSNGAMGEKGIWGTRANWVDYYGTVKGEEVGIAVFDSPRSFRHPTYWHARAYGLFAANPFGIREFTRDPLQDGSWTIPPGKSLLFRYRVLIHHGDDQQAHVAEAYRRYAEQK
ncbi:MAG TPA: PmoA family protein [Terriglobia bacterium]|nr:PmoA family protein [Terriglobia bacterium]